MSAPRPAPRSASGSAPGGVPGSIVEGTDKAVTGRALWRALDRGLAGASAAGICLGGAILGAIALLGAADVAMGALAASPLPAANAFAEELLPAAVFLAMGAAVRAQAHIVVDIVVERLTGPLRHALGLLAALATLGFLAALAHGAWGLAADSIRLGERAVAAIEFPVWPAKTLFALGASLALAESAAACLRAGHALATLRAVGTPRPRRRVA